MMKRAWKRKQDLKQASQPILKTLNSDILNQKPLIFAKTLENLGFQLKIYKNFASDSFLALNHSIITDNFKRDQIFGERDNYF